MNNYNNNFTRIPSGDSPMRFNKRPRYGTNNGGGNISSRFNHQNNSGYQYTSNRNNASDCYSPNQYEERSKRHYYGNNAKRQNLNQQQQNSQSSPYSQKSTISSSLSPSSSFTPPTPINLLQFSPSQPKMSAAQTAPAATTAQNNQQQQLTPNIMDNSNYYGFGYNNYYPVSYNADLTTIPSSSSFGVADGISPFMWQTITSTLPPKLTQNHQPPLPQQQPPPRLPPLPSSGNYPHLLPPPPIPEGIIKSSHTTTTSSKSDQQKQSNSHESATKTVVKMKAKRKAMSVRYKLTKSWSERDVVLALKAEEINTRKLQKDIILIIRFPDPEISREIVKTYSPDIESVYFQLNFAPRYCLVHLKPGADVEKTIDDLSKIPFGTGFLSVEIKQIPHKAHTTKPNEVDPLTLYVGNLPTTIACKTLKEHFPGAARIDIGFAQRMKYTRYAFIRYQNVEQAIEAYKRMLDAEIGGRTLTIRFRRLTAANEGNKDGEAENNDDTHDDLLVQTEVATDDNIPKLSENSSEHAEPVDILENKNNTDIVGHNLNDFSNLTEESTIEKENNTGNNLARETISTDKKLTETTDSMPVVSSARNRSPIQEKSNIKPDPDIDPDDVVIRDNTITSRVEVDKANIKQEEENLSLHVEFFEKPNKQTNCCEKSSGSDRGSLLSAADETDTTSTLSNNSLGEFLQSCQRPQIQTNNIGDLEPTPAKRNKVTDAILPEIIKREPLEYNSIAASQSLQIFARDSVVGLESLKKEPREEDNENNLNVVRNKVSTAQNLCLSIDKRVPESRETDAAANNYADSCNKSINNEDLVPPTALFFSSDYQNKLKNSSNVCDYDEFYETRTHFSSPASTSLANVKTEPSYISRGTLNNTLETNENMQQNKTVNQNTPTKDTLPDKEKQPITSNTFDDYDDNLVPPHNLLGSYRPSQNVIKQETEHDDIFSVPFNKANNRINEDINSEDICNSDLRCQSNNIENTSAVSKTNVSEDNDDDIIIISDNLRRESMETKPNSLVLPNLFLSKQTDLVSILHKPVAVTIPNRVSKLIHRDYLDRLYDQLDTDSDSEL